MSTIADRLKELRKRCSLSQKQISIAVEINERTYRRYEAGDIEPSASNINKLADYFQVSTDYLLGRTDKIESLQNE